jgi:ribosomal protein S18 acetylase RimI-like enzyme
MNASGLCRGNACPADLHNSDRIAIDVHSLRCEVNHSKLRQDQGGSFAKTHLFQGVASFTDKDSQPVHRTISDLMNDLRSHQQNRPNLMIREYGDDDWLAVCDVHDRARPLELRGSCDPQAFVPLAQDQAYADDFRDSKKLVACLANQVVGFVGVNQQCISWLYVDPSYMGQGIGRRLLQRGIQLGGKQVTTIVLVGNRRARHLYASEGFRISRIFAGRNAGYPCLCLELSL